MDRVDPDSVGVQFRRETEITAVNLLRTGDLPGEVPRRPGSDVHASEEDRARHTIDDDLELVATGTDDGGACWDLRCAEERYGHCQNQKSIDHIPPLRFGVIIGSNRIHLRAKNAAARNLSKTGRAGKLRLE